MIDIDREHVMALRHARDWLEERFGQRFAQSTVYHWVTRGAHGRKLDVVRVGGRIFTSAEAFARFFGIGAGATGEEIYRDDRASESATRRAKEVFG